MSTTTPPRTGDGQRPHEGHKQRKAGKPGKAPKPPKAPRSAKGKRGKADKDAAAATDGRHSQRGATNEVQPGTAGVNLLSPWVFDLTCTGRA
ncbi:hypothetical protein [Nocardioides sambongensis]|uniref:hypothetical protein n=1 Tax=Nocardioides sambongensis TaxID=2589074 RepID=UPI00112C8CFD|nr:hypothetical protein [Nocardioides sambongensis]